MNRAIFKILFFVVIIALSVFIFLKYTSTQLSDPWEAITGEPAVILEIDQPAIFFEKLNKNGDFITHLKQIKFVNQLFNKKGKIEKWLTESPELKKQFYNGKILTCVYADSLNNSLTVAASEKEINPEKIVNILRKVLGESYKLTVNENSDRKILKVTETDKNYSVYIASYNNLIIVSKSKMLLNKSLDAAKNGQSIFVSDKLFNKIKKTAGKKVNAKLYLQNDVFKNILSKFVSGKYKNVINGTETIAKYTETDLLIKNNKLIMNGLAIGDTSTPIYQQFMQQTPQTMSITSVMPFNTKMFVFQGFSDFQKWIKNKNITCGIVNVNKLSKLTGNEIALVNTATSKNNFFKKSVLIIKTKDKNKTAELLNASSLKNISLKYNEYTIRKLKNGELLKKLYGEIFGAITENYYTFINDYLIFANNSQELKNLLMYYETGKTLDLNENFKNFSKNLTETSNFTLYIKLNNWIDVAKRYISSSVSKEIDKLQNFETLILQLSGQPPYIYTNVILTYNKQEKKDDLALWKVKLDDEIIKKPFPVKDHLTGKYNFIVFDKSNNVYLIRTDGTIIWKKELDGPPESEVKEVDYYKNGKYQYLFNTAGKIYLIDRKGQFVKGYPVKISPTASNGLSVFDYNKRKDYRILLAQADKRIYNYTLSGKKVKGWHAFKMPEIVIRPVERLVANNKDFIIVTDLDKNIKIVNRRGQERIKLKQHFKIADNSIFYVNKTNSKGILLTTDESGKLIYISASGRLNHTDFGKFSKNHFFLYEDFNSNGVKDFIYVDKNKLTVFNRFKKVLFKYEFDHTVTIKPAFFNVGHKNKILGIVLAQEKTIYLFDNKGNIIINNGLVGEIPFTVVNSNNNREINLITGAGNILFNYRIK